MYLRYQLDSKRFKESFTIDYPVADAKHGKEYMEMLLKQQNDQKKYTKFELLDMKKNPIEVLQMKKNKLIKKIKNTVIKWHR